MRIIHGDNQPESRGLLQEIKEGASKEGLEVVSLVGKTVSLTEVKQAVESSGLFGSDRLLIIEELFSGQTSSGKKEVIEYLKNEAPDSVVIWESKQVDGRRLRALKADVKEFKVSSQVFKFLESIAPGRQRIFMPLWAQIAEQEALELVFFLLMRQVRQLIQVASDEGGFRGPPWLVRKLTAQARVFGLKQLLELHDRLYELELENKTGTGVLPLSARLELLLISL